ncbi:hypothetical protein [Cryptosporangium aurantiacum]|nr:hypothetical protein [Cryptosporangium aurantiacum]
MMILLLTALTLLAPWIGADSRDGMDWRPMSEAERYRLGTTPSIR